jgi:toxin CcdB
MEQFDIYSNPVTTARAAYPYVVNLQSSAAGGGHSTLVAPLALASRFDGMIGRLHPRVRIDAREYILGISELTALPTEELKRRVANVAADRAAIMDSIDLLFFGV